METLSLELRNEIIALVKNEISELKTVDERLTNLELELKHQRELMQQGFEAIDKRFEDNKFYMEKRFEAVDKQFEAVDKQFESVNKRIYLQTWIIGFGFTIITVLMSLYRFFG
ncbi:MAG: hypothetical protein ACPGTO_07800 [Polaribacter sp.]